MKFTLATVAATMVSAAAAASPSAALPSGISLPSGIPVIPKACQEIPQVVGLKPLKLMQYFHEQVCEKNCTATINQHNDYLVNTVYPKIIPDLDEKLGISAEDQQIFNGTRTEAIAAVKKSCTKEGEQPLCNDPKGIFEWGACAVQASQPVYQKHMKELIGAFKLSDAQCEKIKSLDSDDTVWSKTLPGYVDTFAKECEAEN